VTLKLNFDNSAHADHFYHRYVTWCQAQREDYDNHDCFPAIENHPNGYPVIMWWDVDSISKSESDVIFIDSVFEGHNIFEQSVTKQTLDRYPADKHYIFFSSGNFSQIDYPMPYTYDVIFVQYITYILEMVANDTTIVSYCHHNQSDWLSADKSILFNTIIGQKRPERDAFIKKITKTFSNNQYILKYDGELLNDAFSNTYLKHPFKSRPGVHAKSLPGLTRMPLSRISYAVAKKCYFSFFVDTCPLSKDNKEFISGHIIQCFMNQQPFVVLGAPGLLRDIHAAGFRTWGELWDESYDTEPDFYKRLDQCMKVAKSLETFDWKKHNNKIREIAMHNFCNAIASGQRCMAEYKRLEDTVKSLYDRKLVV